MKNLAIICHDGFGSQYLKKMYGFAFCQQMKNYRYVHVPITRVEHLSIDLSKINNFIGWMPTVGRKIHIRINKLMKCFVNPEAFFTDPIVEHIRLKYHSTPKPNADESAIVIHIRRGDVNPRTRRHSARIRFIQEDWYIEHIDKILKKFDNNIIIHSHGNTQIKRLASLNQDRIQIKLNADIFETFHDMVMAEKLFLAKSSLSYMAGILNKNQVYFMNGATNSQLSVPFSRWRNWQDIN